MSRGERGMAGVMSHIMTILDFLWSEDKGEALASRGKRENGSGPDGPADFGLRSGDRGLPEQRKQIGRNTPAHAKANLPLALGMGRPSSFAVSIHS